MGSILLAFPPTFLVLVYWLAIAPGLAGWGLAVRAWSGDRECSLDRLVVSFWVGLVVVVGLLQLTHFVAPVKPYITGPMLVIGWVLLWHRGGAWRTWLATSLRARPRRVVLAILVALWVANRAIGPTESVDSGVYHVQAVRWNVEFPIVTGLANLNSQLGFNSSAWLYDAIFQAGPMNGRGNHGPTALLMLSLALLGGHATLRLLRRDPDVDEPCVFDAMLLAPVLHQILGLDSASFRTDFPTVGITLVAGSRAFRLLALQANSHSAFAELASVALLAAGGIVFKIPTLVLGTGLTLLCAWRWWTLKGEPGIRKLRHLVVVAIAPAIIVLTWAVRGVVICGYLAFPIPASAVDVPWRLPDFMTEALHAWVKQWAWHETLTPPEAYMGWEWVRPWIRNFAGHDPFKFVYPVVCCGGLIGIACVWRWKGRWTPWPSRYWLYPIPLAVALVAWFLTAPSARWANVLSWLMLAWVAAGLMIGGGWGKLDQDGQGWFPRSRAFWLAGAFAITLVIPPSLARLVRLNKVLDRGLVAVPEMLFFKAGPDRGFQPDPEVSLTTFTTDSGLVLTVPVDDDRVFEAPLPATPFPVKNLRLRRPNDLSSGFVLDGGTWAPLRHWPNKGNSWYDRWLFRREQAGQVPLGSPTR